MSLLSRLPVAETWPEIELAAEDRFWDGYALGASGDDRALGAVYLFGYLAEMLLKVAFFRARGVARHSDTAPERHAARTLAATYGRPRNYHDLKYWTFALERMRSANGRPLNAAFAGALTLRVSTLAYHWAESLRYRSVRPTESELHEVVDSVEWIFEHRSELWS
jgi:hypothetical protein